MNPYTPSVLLLTGAIVLFLCRFRSYQITSLTVLIASVAGVLVTLLVGLRLPVVVLLSRWDTGAYFGTPLQLQVDNVSWLLAVALQVGLVSISLVSLSYRGDHEWKYRASQLTVVACALVAIFADNFVTLAIAWVVFDIAIYCSKTSEWGEYRASSEFTVGLLTVALLIASALIGAQTQVSNVLTDGKLTDHSHILLIVASTLRICLYSLHTGTRKFADSRELHLGVMTALASVALGSDIFVGLALSPQSLPVRVWLTFAALILGLMGGWRWYRAKLAQEQLLHLIVTQAGIIILIFLWGGEWAIAGVTAQGMSVLLAVPVLLLYRGNDASKRSRSIISILPVLILTGLPLTVGFVGAMTLFSGLLHAGIWVLVIPALLVIQALLIAGGLRLSMYSGQGPPHEAPVATVGYYLGLAIPISGTLLTGLAPETLGAVTGLSGVYVWAAMLAPDGLVTIGSFLIACGVGAVLWTSTEHLRASIALTRLELALVVAWRWFFGAIWALYRGFASAMRAAALMLEGDGGVLWAVVLATTVWIAMVG